MVLNVCTVKMVYINKIKDWGQPLKKLKYMRPVLNWSCSVPRKMVESKKLDGVRLIARPNKSVTQTFFLPGVHCINTKRRHFKRRQNMVFKRQKRRLTFSKFHKTLLVFKTPKCDLFITNIGILNAKKARRLKLKKEAF